ncbi:hypothetical protein pW4_39 [Bacillus phage pW4]|uniref:Uncharacterized protein n=1 Tax=Bacillus phage pW4 TaxID=2500560 RepID=A0A3T0II25_9CAUD|nr:hypothetical protein PP656_gp094 [Bacillus phage pW4]AZU99060.1 hypothetical protein pW4_39 [Bacillus phage pW4]
MVLKMAVLKFADKVKKLKRTTDVDFIDNEGNAVTFVVTSVKQEALDEINEKYNRLIPAVPTMKVPYKGSFKIIEKQDDPEYKAAVIRNDKERMYEMAALFLREAEGLEGTVEEQVEAIREVELAGFVGKVVNKGLEVSGLLGNDEVEEEIEEGK